tara:strand:- start:5405 stop:5779 length:375 start_codon:yes stop_codon:yes gene_type:complete
MIYMCACVAVKKVLGQGNLDIEVFVGHVKLENVAKRKEKDKQTLVPFYPNDKCEEGADCKLGSGSGGSSSSGGGRSRGRRTGRRVRRRMTIRRRKRKLVASKKNGEDGREKRAEVGEKIEEVRI